MEGHRIDLEPDLFQNPQRSISGVTQDCAWTSPRGLSSNQGPTARPVWGVQSDRYPNYFENVWVNSYI